MISLVRKVALRRQAESARRAAVVASTVGRTGQVAHSSVPVGDDDVSVGSAVQDAVDTSVVVDWHGEELAGSAGIESDVVDVLPDMSEVSWEAEDVGQIAADGADWASELAGQLEVDLAAANVVLGQALSDAADALDEAGLARSEAATAVSDAGQAVSDASQAIQDALAAAGLAQSAKDIAEATADSTVKSVTDEWATSVSATVAPTTGWSSTPPAWSAGTYIWVRTTITYGDDSVSTSDPVVVTGNPGAKGDDGAAGKDGLTVEVVSSQGTFFKNPEIDTILSARVFVGGQEIFGESLDAYGVIRWYENGYYLQGKDGSTIAVAKSDFDATLTFQARLEY